MRVPLIRAAALAAIAVVSSACARAEVGHTASARLHVYADPRITVVSPTVRDELEHDDWRGSADYAVDVVSGATTTLTADAVSTATTFADRRHQIGVGATRVLGAERELGVAYAASLEPDHAVHAPAISGGAELLDRMARAMLRYQLVAETLGRVDERAYRGEALGHRLDAGWTQILTRTLVLGVQATGTLTSCDRRAGCFVNPYRHVGVMVGGAPLALAERHPDRRGTGAAALRVSWAARDDWALHLGYRAAADSWAVRAHGGEAAVATERFTGALLLRLDVRGTVQTAAAFYRARYPAEPLRAPTHRTADPELGALWNVRVQLHAELELGAVRAIAALGRMWNRHDIAPDRDAWLLSLGLDAPL